MLISILVFSFWLSTVYIRKVETSLNAKEDQDVKVNRTDTVKKSVILMIENDRWVNLRSKRCASKWFSH